MTFMKGAAWKASGGNANGRPADFRVKLTAGLVEDNWDDAQAIVKMLGVQARSGNQTSLKLYCTTVLPYFLVKAKAELDITQQGTSELTEAFKFMLPENMELIKKIVIDDMKRREAESE